MLSWVEHEKKFYNLGPVLVLFLIYHHTLMDGHEKIGVLRYHGN